MWSTAVRKRYHFEQEVKFNRNIPVLSSWQKTSLNISSNFSFELDPIIWNVYLFNSVAQHMMCTFVRKWLSRSSPGLSSPSSTAEERTENYDSSNTWNMRMWVPQNTSTQGSKQIPNAQSRTNITRTARQSSNTWLFLFKQQSLEPFASVICFSVIQVIGLLDVFTPAASLEEFNEVWVSARSLYLLLWMHKIVLQMSVKLKWFFRFD